MTPEPIRFDRILFPIDLSEESRRAVPFVKAMASRFNSELVLLQVIEIPAAYYMPPDAAGFDLLSNTDELRALRKSAVEAFIVDQFRDVTVSLDFAEGDPAGQIVHYIRENKSPFIMMPTHGHGTFRRLLLGSVTAKVLHDADCPVWTAVHIRECASSVHELPHRILCAVDADSDAVRVVRWAQNFAQQLEAEIQFVHAARLLENVPPFDKFYREAVLHLAQEEMRMLQEKLGVPFDVTIREGEPEQAIYKAVEDLKADLAIIGRGRLQKPFGRLRSHAYAIIRNAPCPVISV